jgi:hypothetical protein
MLPVTISMEKLKSRPEHLNTNYAGEAGSTFTEALNAAKAAYPNLRFYRVDSRTAWIYFDDSDLYAVAMISYGDARLRIPRNNAAPKYTYNVSSRMIELPNNIKRCKTLEAMLCAIGTEVRALRPVQTVFMATEESVSPAVRAVFAPLVRDLIRKRRELGVTPGGAVEAALAAGTANLQSAAPSTVQLVTEFLELHREVQALDVKNKTVKAVFFDRRGVYVFDVATRYTYDGTPDVFMSSQLRDQQVSVEPVPLDAVDPVIRGRMEVLNIVEPLEFVPNVGLKHSDRLFYVVV